MKKLALVICLFIITATLAHCQIKTHIAAKQVDSEPWMRFPTSYHENQLIQAAVNPAIHNLSGESVDIYITEDKTSEDWDSDLQLLDVRLSGYQTEFFSGSDLTDLWVDLIDSDLLEGINGARPGVSYDLVIDRNQNGVLDSEDIIDGYSKAGMYVVSDMFDPGPHGVDSVDYVSPTGEWQQFRVYYPENISEMEAQPLLVISHGWTHNFWYYDHIGRHMASYGYVVMSHKNDVGNGGAAASNTASQSALQNIDTLLTVYPTLENGILAGKIDLEKIVHSGHSTGGECVVRAYNRLFTGDYVSPFITHENIVCVNSLAPVAFLNADQTHPQGSNYHQFLAAADTDVTGAPVDGYVQALSIYERGYGNKQVTYIHGAGHEDLHDNPGPSWASGPDLIGREATHTVLLPYMVALCELYARENIGMKDFFTRSRDEFRPPNISPEIKVSGEYKDAESAGNFVIDDFESNEDIDISSSGGAVATTLSDHYEVLMKDHDGSFTWFGNQWSNGMCRARYNDAPHCAAFAWDDNEILLYEMNGDTQDWTDYEFLSFRACQLTRHPNNINLGGEIDFTITLTDTENAIRHLNISTYGKIAPPYPKGLGSSSEGSTIDLCLEEGTYTVILGGSNWEEEQSFLIPGFIGGGVGEYELVIGPGNPCTDIQILLFDSWGDGWDSGNLELINAQGDIVVEGTLIDGFGAEDGVGWQNEFHTIRIRLTDFLGGIPGLNLEEISQLEFRVGPEFGSDLGAIAIDDIELVVGDPQVITGIETQLQVNNFGLVIFPNPAIDLVTVVVNPYTGEPWDCVISNLSGDKVWRQSNIRSNRLSIQTRSWASGVYFINATTTNGVLNRKFIVN